MQRHAEVLEKISGGPFVLARRESRCGLARRGVTKDEGSSRCEKDCSLAIGGMSSRGFESEIIVLVERLCTNRGGF